MSKIRVGAVHTFLYAVDDVKGQFQEQLPNVELINIVDDSLLEEALTSRGVTPGILSRLSGYYRNLQDLGCVCAFNSCSSMSEAVDTVEKLLRIPIFKIDVPMAEKAVLTGNRIAVVATAVSTVEPSCRLVENAAKKLGKTVSVDRCFVEGAYDFLRKTGDKRKHDEMVTAKITEAAQTHDVVVLAQASLYHLLPMLGKIKIPVLTSLKSGVEQVRKFLS